MFDKMILIQRMFVYIKLASKHGKMFLFLVLSFIILGFCWVLFSSNMYWLEDNK